MCGSKISTLVLFVCAVGAINWGLVGAANFDLVRWLAEAIKVPVLAQAIYVIVGLAGLFALYESLTCTLSK